MAHFTHKMAPKGPNWGPWRLNFGLLRVPDPPGTIQEWFRMKKNFLKKSRFFDPKMAHFAHKMGPNRPNLGPWRLHFGLLRVPDPPGTFREQKNDWEQKNFRKFRVFFLTPKWGFLGPKRPFLHTKWPQMGPFWARGALILRFWGYQTLRGPSGSDMDQKIFFWKKRVFWPLFGPFCPQNGPKWGGPGGPEREFGVFEGARPSGGPLKVIWSKKNFLIFFAPEPENFSKSFWAKQAKIG
mgnify:CR=1 FL=1